MRLGNYSKAAKGFEQYAVLFPEFDLRDLALISSAQNFNLINDWNNASIYASEALSNPLLNEDLKRTALRVLSESDFKLERWDQSIMSLEKLFRMARDDADRSDSAIMLINCFAKKESFYELFRFLPFCSLSARNSLSLNAALLEAGDIFYHQGEFVKAQLLYRHVIPKIKIRQYELNKLTNIRSQIKPYIPGSDVSLSNHQKIRDKLESEAVSSLSKIEEIDNFFSYDAELLFRLAQCSYDVGRNWIAYKTYLRIYEEYENHNLADQAFYSAFTTMLSEKEWELAKKTGYDYLEKLSEGKYILDTKYNLMKLHMQLNEFDQAVDIGLKTIEFFPDNPFCNDIYYMLGYVAFSKENYTSSLSYFNKILSESSENKNNNEVKYWRSMSLLFLSSYEKSSISFYECLNNLEFKKSPFYNDALYRYGISLYGEEKYNLSKEAFINFITISKDSKLISEAYAMLGDLAASEPNLKQAVSYYEKAIIHSNNINQTNYPLFQKARVLEIMKQYSLIISSMNTYLEQWKESADYSGAIDWIAVSYKKLDEYPKALQVYLDGIEKYGIYQNKDNIDTIINNIIFDYNSDKYIAYKDVIKDWILEKYNTNKHEITSFYYLAILNMIKDNDNEFPVISELSMIKKSSPIILNYICKEAFNKNENNLIYESNNRMHKLFFNSSYTIDISTIAIDTYIIDKKYSEAIELGYRVLKNINIYDKRAGYINLRIADSLRLQERFKESIEIYNTILSDRNWRGDLTPETLFSIGLCYYNQKNFVDAYQYFQRIYVLYGSYLDWTAKSYVKSIYCLDKIGGNKKDIINTFNEMASIDALIVSKEFIDLEKFLLNRGILK